MPEVPLCPDCKNRMVARYVCQHCGFDSNVPRTPQQILEKPFNCVKCGKPTAKKVDGIAVCGDCFTEGWGRFPNMPLEQAANERLTELTDKAVSVTEKFTGVPSEAYQNDPHYYQELPKEYQCPQCKRKFSTKSGLGIHKKRKHGGK